MNITQRKIAQITKISAGHISCIFSGKHEVGKATAKKFAEFTGMSWIDFLTMTPEQIRAVLLEKAENNVH